mmetsp:Transcript_25466/g.42485  ORF Transcript_25466/g.42485 Transcript_25466/m.42485 type:complete len:715 (-) Transcript_25466:2805-4949(-)
MTLPVVILWAIMCMVPIAMVLSQREAEFSPPVVDVSILYRSFNISQPLTKAEHALIRETHMKIDSALKDVGLLIITGHEITNKYHEESLEAVRKLFSVEHSLKLDVSMNSNSRFFGRGYINFGDESGLATIFEPKEGYSYGRSVSNSSSTNISSTSTVGLDGGFDTRALDNREARSSSSSLLNLPNRWPKQYSQGNIEVLSNVYEQNVRIAKLIVGALSTFFDCTQGDDSDDLLSKNVAMQPENTDIDELSSTDDLRNATRRNLLDLAQGGESISLMRLFHYYHMQSNTVRDVLRKQKNQPRRSVENGKEEEEEEEEATAAQEESGLLCSETSTTTSTRASINSSTSSSSSSSSGSYRRAGVNDTDSSMNKSHGLPRGLRLLGSSPHTDWGFLTIIMADNVQGLQFLPKSVSTSIPGQKMEEEEEEEKRWIDVPHIPGSLVINAGDYLQLVSKGVYHSPVHRVLVPGTTTTSSTAGTSTSTSTSTSSIVSSSDTCNDSSSSNKSSNSSSTSSNNSCSSSGGRGEGHQQYTSAMSDADQKERNEATTTGTTTTTNDSDGDRYSMVFFFYPGYDNLVSDAVLGHCTHYSDNRSISHGSMASGTSVPDQSVSGSSSRSRSSSGGDTAAAGTVIGDGGGTSELSTPAKRMEKVGRQKHSPAYNTLLTMTTDSSSHMMGDPSDNKENLKNGDNHHHDIQNLIPSFGDYIIKKWMDVYRA